MEQADYLEQEHTKTSTNQATLPTPKSKRSDNTKRFSDEQVKSLESMFHREAKLEPRNKQQLAKDLGLQPRQVSIWFQNKRARWKSKKLEQEYAVLKTDFDALCGRYESLKKENESLLHQLGRVNRILENPRREQSSSRGSNENGMNVAPANRDENSEQRESHERATNSDNDRAGINRFFGKQGEPDCITFSDQEDSCKASGKQWWSFVSSGGLDEPCCPSSWWDF